MKQSAGMLRDDSSNKEPARLCILAAIELDPHRRAEAGIVDGNDTFN
jgi:hypothetical protein